MLHTVSVALLHHTALRPVASPAANIEGRMSTFRSITLRRHSMYMRVVMLARCSILIHQARYWPQSAYMVAHSCSLLLIILNRLRALSHLH